MRARQRERGREREGGGREREREESAPPVHAFNEAIYKNYIEN